MKNMTKIALLLAVLAAGNSAQAQQGQLVAADRSYVFSSTTDADGIGDISYQWYRDGVAIPNATGEIYILPADLAQGKHVEFKRGARSTACPGNIKYSNAFVVTFCKGLVVGSLCWADRNVDDYQTFAVRPDMYTKYYQWNRPFAWAVTGTATGWNSIEDQSSIWTINPCPAGWRLPEVAELQALHNGSIPVGGTWVGANVKGNAVAGRFYGPNSATCSLPNSIDGCVFLPAVGNRLYLDGTLGYQDSGRYWSGMQFDAISGYALVFDSSTNDPAYQGSKSNARSLRCVQ